MREKFFSNPEKFSSDDLKKYYKLINVCLYCGREYGLSTKKDNGRCPICVSKLKMEAKENGKGVQKY